MTYRSQWFHVEAPHFSAALAVAYDRVIVDAAPILFWAVGKNFAWFKRYAARKTWALYSFRGDA